VSLALHPRVIHARDLRKHPLALYVGRGRCPCRDYGCGPTSEGDFGNPFTVEAHGVGAILRFVDLLASFDPDHQEHVQRVCKGRVLACWCRGKLPLCHGDALAHFSDGVPLDVIREWVMQVLGCAA
jgi:hypothetical protein